MPVQQLQGESVVDRVALPVMPILGAPKTATADRKLLAHHSQQPEMKKKP
jgi:hypothetical protein